VHLDVKQIDVYCNFLNYIISYHFVVESSYRSKGRGSILGVTKFSEK
jgi:hypothetical protein